MGRILDRMEHPSVRYEWWGKPNHEPLTFGYRRAERVAIRRLSPRYGNRAVIGALVVVRRAMREGRLTQFDASAVVDTLAGGHRHSMLFAGFARNANHRVWILRDAIAKLRGGRQPIPSRHRRLTAQSYVGEQLARHVGTWRFEHLADSPGDGSMGRPLNGRADFGGFTFADLGSEADTIAELDGDLPAIAPPVWKFTHSFKDALDDVDPPEVRDTKALVAAPRPGPFASVMLAAA